VLDYLLCVTPGGWVFHYFSLHLLPGQNGQYITLGSFVSSCSLSGCLHMEQVTVAVI